jgi:hypothetical protein
VLELGCPRATPVPRNPSSATNQNHIFRQRERTSRGRQPTFVNDFEQTVAEFSERKSVWSKPVVRASRDICLDFEVDQPSPFSLFGHLVENRCWDEKDLVIESKLARVENGEEVPEPGVVLESVRLQVKAQVQVGLPTMYAGSMQSEPDLDLDADSGQVLQVAAYFRVTTLVIGRRRVYL